MTHTAHSMTPITLVLGGTGKTGRRLAARLTALGVPVRIGSRTGTPPFDWDEPTTWPGALDGVGAAYLAYYPDLAVPGAVDVVAALATAAVRRGVTRLVLLSGRGEDEAQRAERAVAQVAQDAGAQWTVLRASWFAQNFSEGLLLDGVLDGVLALPVGAVREPFVDAEDIADVAVAVLTDDAGTGGGRHGGQVYELTGPRALTFDEVADAIAAASGREVRFDAVTTGDYTAALTRQGMPADVVGLLVYLCTEVLDGRNTAVADGVQRALGRAPRDFADFVAAAAAAGAWAPAVMTPALVGASAATYPRPT